MTWYDIKVRSVLIALGPLPAHNSFQLIFKAGKARLKFR